MSAVEVDRVIVIRRFLQERGRGRVTKERGSGWARLAGKALLRDRDRSFGDFRSSVVKRALHVALLLLLGTPFSSWAQSSAYDHGPLERLRDPLAGRADIGGRVYEDRGAAGIAPEDSPGISGVVIFLDDGRYTVSGPDGWWQLSDVSPGQRAIRFSEKTLPLGGLAPMSRFIREVPPGAFVRIDMPVEIETDEVVLGREEVLGFSVFPTIETLPTTVVGNTTDIQALIDGKRISFPRADLEISGLAAGGFVRPDGLDRLVFSLAEQWEPEPQSWRLSLVTADGDTVREIGRDGEPPRRVGFDGRDEEGDPFAGPASYGAQLCVEYEDGSSACSPFRPFGVLGAEGARPELEIPREEPSALIAGEQATIDDDGSFIFPAELHEGDAEIEIGRGDGRSARTTVPVPKITVLQPTEALFIEWGENEDLYSAPDEPGPITIEIRGTASPESGELLLDDEPLHLEKGEWSSEIEVPIGRSRFELSLTAPDGVGVTRELHFYLGDDCPEGEPIVVQAAEPSLEIELPPDHLMMWRGDVRARGRAEAEATVLANGAPLSLDEEGRFDEEIEIDPGEPAIEIVATDPDGRTTGFSRSWQAAGPTSVADAFANAEPYARLVHDDTDDDPLRLGLAGAASLSAARMTFEGTSLFAGVSAAPADRTGSIDGTYATGGARGGLETWLGDRLLAGLRYEGVAFFQDESDGEADAVLMRHDARLTGALLAESLDVLVDAGIDSGPPDADDSNVLAGGGLAFRLRAAQSLSLRARVGASFALAGSEDGTEGALDASAQLMYRPARENLPTVGLRLARIGVEPSRFPEATGEVFHLTLAWPMLDRVRFVQAAGGWFTDRGAFTALSNSRLELMLMEKTLIAADYRLLAQTESQAHRASLEGAHRLKPWLRVGGVYQLDTFNNGGETSSRLQARIQALF